MDAIKKILTEKQISYHHKENICLVNVFNSSQGIDLAETILEKVIDKKTLLLLSGGRTPKELYKALAKHEQLIPGAVGMIDERYGKKLHQNSNETMMRDGGLLRYLAIKDIPFYPILANDDASCMQVATDYDMKLRELQQIYPKTVGILGIGLDGHTAGIPARTPEVHLVDSELEEKTRFVASYNDTSGKYGERVTMTFLGLSYIDTFIVLVFGQDKYDALQKVFSSGLEDEIPGRFFLRPEIAHNTLIITDQRAA